MGRGWTAGASPGRLERFKLHLCDSRCLLWLLLPPAAPFGDMSVSSADGVRVYLISLRPRLTKALVCPSPGPLALLLHPRCWVFCTQSPWVTPPGTDPQRLSAASAGRPAKCQPLGQREDSAAPQVGWGRVGCQSRTGHTAISQCAQGRHSPDGARLQRDLPAGALSPRSLDTIENVLLLCTGICLALLSELRHLLLRGPTGVKRKEPMEQTALCVSPCPACSPQVMGAAFGF